MFIAKRFHHKKKYSESFCLKSIVLILQHYIGVYKAIRINIDDLTSSLNGYISSQSLPFCFSLFFLFVEDIILLKLITIDSQTFLSAECRWLPTCYQHNPISRI